MLKIIEDKAEGHTYKQLADFCQDQTGKIYLLKSLQAPAPRLLNCLLLYKNIKYSNWHESCFNVLRPSYPATPAVVQPQKAKRNAYCDNQR
jgi:hypothetical protein